MPNKNPPSQPPGLSPKLFERPAEAMSTPHGHHRRHVPDSVLCELAPAGTHQHIDGEAHAALDGISHININTGSTTELGKGLAHFAYAPFQHPYYGPFNSMEGLWYYLKSVTTDDHLRVLHGHAAKSYGRKLPMQLVDNFCPIIIAANFYKLEQNPALLALFMACDLPFDHYYLWGPGNVLIRPAGMEWLVQGFHDIRTMFKEGRRPEPIDYKP